MDGLNFNAVLRKVKTVKKEKPPAHELAACVNEIIKVVGTTKVYNYGYWLRKVQRSNMCFNDIMGLLKQTKDLPDKYNRGGYLTNQLCGKKKNLVSPNTIK